MSLKDRLALSADRGQNWKGLFYLAGPVIFSMPDDLERTVLITVWFLCMAWVSWLTRGNVDLEIAADLNAVKEPEFASEQPAQRRTLKDVVREGRE